MNPGESVMLGGVTVTDVLMSANASQCIPALCLEGFGWLFPAQEHPGWEPKAELNKRLTETHLPGHSWGTQKGVN